MQNVKTMSKILDIWLIVFMLVGNTTALACYSTTLYATTLRFTSSVLHYSNNEYCTIKIRPAPGSRSYGYYLEIEWLSFNVKGNMPDCNNDYVEVFVTKYDKSIGKYCSSNFQNSSLFNMYSYDSYAKLQFKSDSSGGTGRGFSFSYQLRPIDEYLGSLYGTGTYCSSSTNYLSSTHISSQGWPYKYAQSLSACTQKVYVGSGNQARVAFMDIDTNDYFYCGYSNSDYVELQGSGSSDTSVHNSISGKLCYTSHIKAYTVKDKYYFYIKFNRKKGSSSKRGFVSGFVIYKPPKSDSTAKIAGVVASIVIFVVVVIIIIYRHKLCKKKTSDSVFVTRNPTNTGILATNNATCTGTVLMSPTVNAYPGIHPETQHAPSANSTIFAGPTAANSNEASSSIATIHPTGPLAAQSPLYGDGPTSQNYSRGQTPSAPSLEVSNEPPPAYDEIYPAGP